MTERSHYFESKKGRQKPTFYWAPRDEGVAGKLYKELNVAPDDSLEVVLLKVDTTELRTDTVNEFRTGMRREREAARIREEIPYGIVLKLIDRYGQEEIKDLEIMQGVIAKALRVEGPQRCKTVKNFTGYGL